MAPVKRPKQTFQFIDNSPHSASATNSTQIRRHVMQEYMKQKRFASRSENHAGQEQYDDPDVSQSPPLSPKRKVSCPTPRNLESSTRNRSAKSRKVGPNVASQHQTSQHDPRKTAPGQTSSTSPRLSPPPPPWPLAPMSHTGHPSPPLNDSARVQIPPDQGHLQESNVTATVPVAADTQPYGLVPNHPQPKRPRQSFYLTPQTFAAIADMFDYVPISPPPSIHSGPTWSSASGSDNDSVRPEATPSPDPHTMLSAARTDPFDCLPMRLSVQDQELFDFYATVMPACSYGFERRSPFAHNWYLSVFIPEAMKSPVAFQNTILVHAANTQAWVRGLAETPLAIEHRARATQMLREHAQNHPTDTSDAAISSTLSAAALEDFDPRIERRQYAWLHWNIAVRKIRDRGGPSALHQSESLRVLINWSDYIFSGYNGLGSTFYFDHNLSQSADGADELEVIGRREIHLQCEELIVFLRCAEHLATVASNLQSNPIAVNSRRMRYSVFQKGHPLYELLAKPNGPRYTETGQLKQILSRLAALMTINVAIWEYRYSEKASEAFFSELEENIKYNDLDKHISVEALIQILLSGSRNPALLHTERPWLVGRLLKVAKRLSRPSWERLNDFLLHCLTLGPSFRPELQEWEPELKDEILSAPLVSHVLPLMQPSEVDPQG